ncbi:MAG: UDP-N-acetylmuramate dehydrogenase [Acidobacteriota bacterium]
MPCASDLPPRPAGATFPRMIQALQQKFPRVQFILDESLALHTTIRIGGPAAAWTVAADESLLVELLGCLNEIGMRHLLMGGGSNLLFDSAGLEGVAIANEVRWLRRIEDGIECSGGVELRELVRFASEEGLEGLEFATGIPGSVGGALAGNAGAYGSNIGEITRSSRLLRAGSVQTVDADYFQFGYRRSHLQTTGETILSVRLRLDRARNVAASRKRCAEILADRARKHPGPDVPSAGSYFKNLDRFDESGRRIPAGLLLDQVRCRGLRIGGAQVYEKHANIIVNRGDATSGDILALAAEMRRRVLEEFGVELQPEVRYIPPVVV